MAIFGMKGCFHLFNAFKTANLEANKCIYRGPSTLLHSRTRNKLNERTTISDEEYLERIILKHGTPSRSTTSLNMSVPRILPYKNKNLRRKAFQNDLCIYLGHKLLISPVFAAYVINKHPKNSFINLTDVQNTLAYLFHLSFKREVIVESLPICLYPVNQIRDGFMKIKANEEALRKKGLTRGIAELCTTSFRLGTTLRDKRLQLCLYYMELPFGFNGCGVYPHKDIDSIELELHEDECRTISM